MPFSLIEPQSITSLSVLENTAYDSDYPEYASGLTYAIGDRVALVSLQNATDITIASPANFSATPSATGAELITNGTFTTNTAGWTAASKDASPLPTLSVDAGRLKMQATAGGLVPRAIYQVPLVAGTTYELTIDYEAYGWRCDALVGGALGNLVDSVGIGSITGTLTQTLRFTSSYTDPTGTYIQLRMVLTTPATGAEFAHFDNVSLKTVTTVPHGFLDGDTVAFTTTGALPTGLTANTAYTLSLIDDYNYNLLDSTGNLVTTSGTQSGVHTAVVDVNSVYESLTAANTGNDPRLTGSTDWIRVSATNNFNMFDQSPNSQSLNPDEIKVKIQAQGITDSVALLNLNASTVRYRVQDTLNQNTVTMTIATPCVVTQVAHGFVDGSIIVLETTGALPTGLVVDVNYYIVNATADTYELSATSGGASIATTGTQSGVHTARAVEYDSTYTLEAGMLDASWYSYLYDPILRDTDTVELEFPRLNNPIIDVWMTATGETVICGGLVIGRRFEIGDSQYGATAGIQDYSVKTVDDFGNYTINERAYAKRGNFTVWLPSARTSGVISQLAKYRATPIVYVGTEVHAGTIIYGFYKDFSVDIAMYDTSVCTIQVDGLK